MIGERSKEPTNRRTRNRRIAIALLVGCPVLWTPAESSVATAQGTIVLKSAELHIGNGTILAKGMVVVKDGRIAAIGRDLSVPAGATLIEIEGGSITPGLIDANAALEPTDVMTPSPRSAHDVLHDLFTPRGHQHKGVGCCGSTCPRMLHHVDGKQCESCGFPNAAPSFSVGTRSVVRVEQSSEVVPHTRVIDSVNLYSTDFDRLLRGGVTTVFVAPDSAAVISAQGAIVRTGGPINERIVREAGAVKASMGTDPSWRGGRNQLPFRDRVSFRSRRPTTRMGVTWVFRKAFHDTKRHIDGLAIRGADAPDPEAMAVLERVLSGEVALRIQARTQPDILSAIRLSKEFGIPFVLEEATEAYRCLDEIKAHGIGVIYGPIYVTAPGYRAMSREVNRARLHTMKALVDAGIETALTAHELRDEDGLARQAMYAVRYGLDRSQVMRSLTEIPARMLGIDKEVGTLQRGKRADIVLWRGQPFEATSSPVVVIVGGLIVLDRRAG